MRSGRRGQRGAHQGRADRHGVARFGAGAAAGSGGQAAIEVSSQRSHATRALVLGLGTWGLYFCVVWPRMLFERSDGLYAGWRTVWADWVAHFSYANVFAYWPVTDWFSTHPLFATQGFDYPFLVNALSGLLMRAGLDRSWAFLGPSLIASLALVALLMFFYVRMLRTPGAALLACTLFFTNGGMGFVDFADQLIREPSLELLGFPPREYTYYPDREIHWINIVSSEILPQRALLLGMPVALLVLIAIWRHARSGFENASIPGLCGLGVLASLLVVTHTHSFLALVVLCACLFCFHLRHTRHWLVFAVAAGVPSLLLLALLYGDVGSRGFLAWYPGWLANPARGGETTLWLFLWLNWGVFLPLAAMGVVRFRYYRDPLVLGGIALFLLSFLVRFQPNEWDNTKLLTWAHLLLCVPAARYLASLWARRGVPARALAVLLFVFASASGFLEVWRVSRTERVAVRMWSTQELQLAESLRALSPPDATVLCSDDHHHWVPSISGRRVLLGYRGWLASYGIDYSDVERDVRTMLQGGPGTEALMARYGIDFVVIGPSERREFGAEAGYFRGAHDLVLEGAGTEVFRVEPPPGRSAS